jgi:hypothetical protein
MHERGLSESTRMHDLGSCNISYMSQGVGDILCKHELGVSKHTKHEPGCRNTLHMSGGCRDTDEIQTPEIVHVYVT